LDLYSPSCREGAFSETHIAPVVLHETREDRTHANQPVKGSGPKKRPHATKPARAR
jgi:hypothetical protein